MVSVENLLAAWQEFLPGKRAKRDVAAFGANLLDNVIELHEDLATGHYRHGGYAHFRVADPKPRDIHKASIRDRLLHHAIHRQLYPFFDRMFIADSFSCRVGKGTHAALDRFRRMAWKESRNGSRTCWALKCDVRKFFASVDHAILRRILTEYVLDKKIAGLLEEVIESFEVAPGKGLPLGNLTSQLFANVYLNELDQFVKHFLKAKRYIRYADDFVVFSYDRQFLNTVLSSIRVFLRDRLALEFHPDKIFIKTIASGVDFLGWVHCPDYRTLRTATKRRMFRRINESPAAETPASYLGMLSHGDAFKISQDVRNAAWLAGDRQ